MNRKKLFILAVFIATGLVLSFSAKLSFASPKTTLSGLAAENIYGRRLFLASRQEVSLDLEEVRLIAVLKMLSQQTGLNFISTEAVRDRRITAYLDQVPLKEAMEIIFQANNLTYDYYPQAKMFVVKEMGLPERELEARVYHLEYARLASSRMQSEIDAILEERGQGERTAVRPDTRARMGIREAVEAVLTENGRVIENSFSNSLVVVDSPSRFPVIDKVIKELDIPPLKVRIEVEVLDVSKDAIDDIGLKYSDGVTATLRPYPDPVNISGIGSFTKAAILDLSGTDITAQLKASDTTAKTLARPRILTLNNETAEINVVSDEVIGLDAEIDRETGRPLRWTAERISDIGPYRGSGVNLRVTPQVSPSGDHITLIVHPSVVKTSLSTFEDELGNVYRNIEDRSTRSVVRLQDGETLLLGGLIKEDESEILTNVPFLSNIPLLGALFRHKSNSAGERELMIFLTPYVVQDQASVKAAPSFLRREQEDLSRRKSISQLLDNFALR